MPQRSGLSPASCLSVPCPLARAKTSACSILIALLVCWRCCCRGRQAAAAAAPVMVPPQPPLAEKRVTRVELNRGYFIIPAEQRSAVEGLGLCNGDDVHVRSSTGAAYKCMYRPEMKVRPAAAACSIYCAARQGCRQCGEVTALSAPLCRRAPCLWGWGTFTSTKGSQSAVTWCSNLASPTRTGGRRYSLQVFFPGLVLAGLYDAAAPAGHGHCCPSQGGTC